MDREQKAQAVAELTDRLKEAEAIFAVDYRGISVTQAAELRGRLREADATFTVVKNRLAKRAIADAKTEGLDDLLIGPTALTLIKGDAVIAAKAISGFSRENEVLEFKGGVMDGAAVDADQFKAIARLPGLDVLHGQLVGLAASPLTGLVAGMSNLISGLGRQLAQMAEQGLVTGEAPAAEEPEAEAPAETEAADEPAGEDETPAAEAEQPTPEEDQPEEAAGEPESPAAADAEEGAAEGAEETSNEEETDGEEQESPDAETDDNEEGSSDEAADGESSEDSESEE